MITAAIKSTNPVGQTQERTMPSPKEIAHRPRIRWSLKQPFVQHLGLFKIGTSVSLKLALKGYSSIYGSAEKCYAFLFSAV